MTTVPVKKAVAKKAAPKLAGAPAGTGPDKRTVITSAGTSEVSEFADPEQIKEELLASEEAGKFINLEVEELKALAEFFIKDIVAVDDNDPSRSELLAALASSDEDGGKPVTWEDYTELFLPSRPSKAVDTPQVEAGNPFEEKVAGETTTEEEEDEVLVFMERKNPRYDIAGYTFTSEHPFNAVPESVAEFIIKSGGFRTAMPSEVQDYYN